MDEFLTSGDPYNDMSRQLDNDLSRVADAMAHPMRTAAEAVLDSY